MNYTSISLVVADDHPVVLHGLLSLLQNELDFDVLASCGDGAAALDAILAYAPSIALLDLRLPKMSALEVLDKVSNQNLKTRIVILTAFTEDRDVLMAVSRGVYGIIMKDVVANVLLECLRTVSMGNRCVPPGLFAREMHRLNEAASIYKTLTTREREVMRLIGEGLSNREVAEWLAISEGTVKLHVHHIYSKIGLNTRPALIALVHRIGAEA